MKIQKFKEKGITLIALVIIIIVLIILAGITLIILFNLGILNNSQKVVGESAIHNNETLYKKEEITVAKDNTNGIENVPFLEEEEPSYKNPVIPVGFKTKETPDASWEIAEDGKSLKNWNNGLVIEDNEHNEFVWVPAYVDKIEDETISQEKIDEYEANKIPKYEKWDGSVTYVKASETTDDTLPMLKESATQDQIKECEEKQIEVYGGFYIGRYEAGTELSYNERKNKDITPIVKQNQKPLNSIGSYEAKASAESMYNDSDYIQSVLVTGTMWDTVMKWLELNEVNVQTQTKENAWGNYSDVEVTEVSGYWDDTDYKAYYMGDDTWKEPDDRIKPVNINGILKTGESEFTKKKNIYDLAGNMCEWTNEKYSCYSGHVARGSSYISSASTAPAMIRETFLMALVPMVVGYTPRPDDYKEIINGSEHSFRVGLYIK